MFSAAVGVSLAIGGQAAKLTVEATKLYRAKKYEEACSVFERVTELSPTSATAWGDYGLCLGHLSKRTSEAARADRKAIELAPKSERVRKAAYYNLGRLGIAGLAESYVPGPTEDDSIAAVEGPLPPCVIFERAPGCERPMWGCYRSPYFDTGWIRFARDPRTILKKAWPEGWSYNDMEQPAVTFGSDVAVIWDSTVDIIASSICMRDVRCRVVWADACTGHVGLFCDVAWRDTLPGEADYSHLPDDGLPCPQKAAVAVELTVS